MQARDPHWIASLRRVRLFARATSPKQIGKRQLTGLALAVFGIRTNGINKVSGIAPILSQKLSLLDIRKAKLLLAEVAGLELSVPPRRLQPVGIGGLRMN